MNTKNNSRNPFVASLNAVPACQMRDEDTDWFPAVDVTEAGQEYVFEVDLPGLKPEEIQVRADPEGLFISGQRVPRQQGGKRLRVERPSGAFVRQLPWPPNTTGEILGSSCDGVLELRIPKIRESSDSNQVRTGHHQPEEVAP